MLVSRFGPRLVIPGRGVVGVATALTTLDSPVSPGVLLAHGIRFALGAASRDLPDG